MNPEEFYRTNAIALVAYLKLKNHTPQDMRWEGSSVTCFWYFRVSPALMAEVDTFLEGRGVVEPLEYNRVFQATKRDFWETDPRPPEQRRRHN